MKVITKMRITAILLITSGTILAQEFIANELIREQITKTQWQQKGLAFMFGVHSRLGVESIVNQLPMHIAQDIVKFAKPKEEEYGFIKNFGCRPIVYFSFVSYRLGCTIMPDIFIAQLHQMRFSSESKWPLWHGWGVCCGEKVTISFRRLGERTMTIKDVLIYDHMNLNIYI